MPINIQDVTFIEEEDLSPLVDLELEIDLIRIELVRKQTELKKTLVALRRKLGLKMSDTIDLAQGVALPLEKAIEANSNTETGAVEQQVPI
jgi:hypothetical protein